MDYNAVERILEYSRILALEMPSAKWKLNLNIDMIKLDLNSKKIYQEIIFAFHRTVKNCLFFFNRIIYYSILASMDGYLHSLYRCLLGMYIPTKTDEFLEKFRGWWVKSVLLSNVSCSDFSL